MTTMPRTSKAHQYLRLHLADAIGPVMPGRLIKHFGTVESILGGGGLG